MPETFASIQKLWSRASEEDKIDYLFMALSAFRDETQAHCGAMETGCASKYMTKKQARVFLIIGLSLAIGVGLGAGYISFSQIVGTAVKVAT